MRQILPALFTAMPFVMAVLLGLVLPLLALQCYRHFSVGLVVVVLSFLVDVYFQQSVGIELGLKIYTADFALLLVGAIGGLRWLAAPDQPRRHWPWLVFSVVFFVALGLGLANNGTAAGVQARGDFYSLAAATYAMSFPIGQRQVRQLADAMVWAATAIMGLCVYRWIVYYTPIRDLLPPEGTYNIDGAIRVVSSYNALVVAQTLLLGILFAGISRGTGLARLLAPLLLAATVVLQHRSVWVAAVVGVLASLFMARGHNASRAQQLLSLAAIVLVTSLALVVGDRGGGLSGQITRSASTALAGQGTANARVENWRATLSEWAGAGPRAIAIGKGFGGDTTRYIYTENGERRKINFGAHNNYVSVLTAMGIIGFSAWLLSVGYVMRGLYRLCSNGQGGVEAAGLFMLMCTQIVYYIAYGTDYFQSLIFGVSLAFVLQAQKAARSKPRVGTSIARRKPVFVYGLVPRSRS